MDRVVHPAERSMQRAILAIESFLASNEEITPDRLRELSRNLQHAKAARDKCADRCPATSSYSELGKRYRRCLERLRIRLAQFESSLEIKRSRLLEEQSRLSRTRQWHSLLGRTH
jgi:hypothetical protein